MLGEGRCWSEGIAISGLHRQVGTRLRELLHQGVLRHGQHRQSEALNLWSEVAWDKGADIGKARRRVGKRHVGMERHARVELRNDVRDRRWGGIDSVGFRGIALRERAASHAVLSSSPVLRIKAFSVLASYRKNTKTYDERANQAAPVSWLYLHRTLGSGVDASRKTQFWPMSDVENSLHRRKRSALADGRLDLTRHWEETREELSLDRSRGGLVVDRLRLNDRSTGKLSEKLGGWCSEAIRRSEHLGIRHASGMQAVQGRLVSMLKAKIEAESLRSSGDSLKSR